MPRSGIRDRNVFHCVGGLEAARHAQVISLAEKGKEERQYEECEEGVVS
jgi:hypothetical protein